VRMSRLFGETLRDAPAGIESQGHQFLLRAGYVRRWPRRFSYLPLGWQAMLHIQQILREELTAIGGVELSLADRASGRAVAVERQVSVDRSRAHRFQDRRTGTWCSR